MTIHARAELAPVFVISLALIHIALLLSDTDYTPACFRPLAFSTLTLILLSRLVRGYLLNPWLYQWIGQERGGLSVKQVKKYSSTARLVTNYVVDFAGNVGICALLASTFVLDSYNQAIRTSVLLYVGLVLPNVHHYFWEDRNWKLILTIELYQLLRRVVGACALVYFAGICKESLPGTIDAFPTNALTIPIIPCLFMVMLRFILGFLWYGPLFGRVWLQAMRQWKRDKSFPNGKMANAQMPYLLACGFVCGLIQSFCMLELQSEMGVAFSLEESLKTAYTLYFFFVLPTLSVDLWENKPYQLCFVNYSLYLVELLLLFAVNAIYQTMWK